MTILFYFIRFLSMQHCSVQKAAPNVILNIFLRMIDFCNLIFKCIKLQN